MRLLFVFLFLCMLAACGQKGPLYLPQPEEPQPEEPQPEESPTAKESQK
jgi:predicted small lipoprotein YifL